MTWRQPVFAAVGLLLFAQGVLRADLEFEAVAIHLEQNATENDAEIVIDVTSGDVGMASLKVVAPDGRTIVDFKSPDSKFGLRHFAVETPEPKNDGRLQKDFPEGEYTFTATTLKGVKLTSKAELSHKMPEIVASFKPAADAKDVPTKGLQITWSGVKNLKGYIVTVEQEESGHEIKATLPSTATTFSVPDGFLTPGTEYKVSIGTVAENGNMSFVEADFTTAGKK